MNAFSLIKYLSRLGHVFKQCYAFMNNLLHKTVMRILIIMSPNELMDLFEWQIIFMFSVVKLSWK